MKRINTATIHIRKTGKEYNSEDRKRLITERLNTEAGGKHMKILAEERQENRHD